MIAIAVIASILLFAATIYLLYLFWMDGMTTGYKQLAREVHLASRLMSQDEQAAFAKALADHVKRGGKLP